MRSKNSKRLLNPPSLWKATLSCSEEQFVQLAKEFAPQLKLNDWVLLEGPMGAGKSTFARALLSALKINRPAEGSPTFALAHEYLWKEGTVAHLDFYRIHSELEIEHAGLAHYFWEKDCLVLAEWTSLWPDFKRRLLIKSHYEIHLDFVEGSPHQRSIKIMRRQGS